MSVYRSWPSATTTTYSNGQGVLLRVIPDEGWYLVSDLTGLRHGEGASVAEALRSWVEHVEAILGMDNLGEPLLSEVNCYRLALAAPPSPEQEREAFHDTRQDDFDREQMERAEHEDAVSPEQEQQ